MFSFSLFLSSFSPFFLEKHRANISLGKSLIYYWMVWLVLCGVLIASSVSLGWIFITPERTTQWLQKIPEFSFQIQDGVLIETGLPQDPFTLLDDQGAIVFISKQMTGITEEIKRTNGIYMFRDHVLILQGQSATQKEQKIMYTDIPELKNISLNKNTINNIVLSELTNIKKSLSIIVSLSFLFISIIVAIWYLLWSLLWGWVVWLLTRGGKHPLSYEQSLGFVLNVFFPVFILSLVLGGLGVWFPFMMTGLFILMLGYNHLRFYSEPTNLQ